VGCVVSLLYGVWRLGRVCLGPWRTYCPVFSALVCAVCWCLTVTSGVCGVGAVGLGHRLPCSVFPIPSPSSPSVLSHMMHNRGWVVCRCLACGPAVRSPVTSCRTSCDARVCSCGRGCASRYASLLSAAVLPHHAQEWLLIPPTVSAFGWDAQCRHDQRVHDLRAIYRPECSRCGRHRWRPSPRPNDRPRPRPRPSPWHLQQAAAVPPSLRTTSPRQRQHVPRPPTRRWLVPGAEGGTGSRGSRAPCTPRGWGWGQGWGVTGLPSCTAPGAPASAVP
jgi:hypothetical protein